jgi:hypothetical protein
MTRGILHTADLDSARSSSEPDLASFRVDPDEEVPSYETSQRMHHSRSPTATRHSSVLEAYTVQPMQALPLQPRRRLLGRRATSDAMAGETADGADGAFMAMSPHAGVLPAPVGPLLATAAAAAAPRDKKRSLKRLGLKFLNARQHFALACCRDLSLIPCLYGLVQLWRRVLLQEQTNAMYINGVLHESLTGARTSEHFLTGVWCIVLGYLLHLVLDGLMVRWIVTYLTLAAIVRMLSMLTIMITVEQYLVETFSAQGYKYSLHIWILISCCLTVMFIIQNFVTLNLDLRDGKTRARFFDFYNIAVFCVVPVGLASFITMIGLLRGLLILRLDLEVSHSPLGGT